MLCGLLYQSSKRGNYKWLKVNVFLRETNELAQKAEKDIYTGLLCPRLEEYLKVIFPHTND